MPYLIMTKYFVCARKVLAWMSIFTVSICGQSRALPLQTERPVFEVASVKPAPQARAVSVIPRKSGDHISYITTLQIVLCYAYDLQPFQLSGAELPGTFDFEATTGGPTDEKVVRQMFQSLLADRFRLRVHYESKETNVYILSMGNKGLRLKPADTAGSDSDPSVSSGRVDLYMQKSGPRLVGKHASMGQLAAGLSRAVRAPVIDRTGIADLFDLDLDCSFDDPQQGPTQPGDLAWAVSSAVTRLGLALKPGKGPVETLVVDHVEQPGAN
jgi:uncharacterized protein (TIGR03435 family)